MREVNKEIVSEILVNMPLNKHEVLRKACERNSYFTSYYGLDSCNLTVYKEGWLVELTGCKTHFQVWANDNDGQFKFGRKPAENKLHKLYSEWTMASMNIDPDDYLSIHLY